MGLSTLLQIHRSAGREGIAFRLDDIGQACGVCSNSPAPTST
jgi:hypothetical protein